MLYYPKIYNNTGQDTEVLARHSKAKETVMETMQAEWRSAENLAAAAPSLDFIRAVAELLETNPDDILTELGYAHSEELLLATVEV